jgi:hypothetical protein
MKQRRIIQISGADTAESSCVYALCDDGAVCCYDFEEKIWLELAPISRCKKLVKKKLTFKDGKPALVEEYES